MATHFPRHALLGAFLLAISCGDPEHIFEQGRICVWTTRPLHAVATDVDRFLSRHPDIDLWCDGLADENAWQGSRDGPNGQRVAWRVGYFSTGDLVNRLERMAPEERPDVLWSVGLSHVRSLASGVDGVLPLRSYAPLGTEAIIEAMPQRSPGWREAFDQEFLGPWLKADGRREKSKLTGPRYTGIIGYVVTFCVHEQRLRSLCAEGTDCEVKPYQYWTPKDGFSWAEMQHPMFKGRIVMPRPDVSGSALVTFNALRNLIPGFEFWRLDQNLALYTKSGSRPCDEVLADENLVVGISYDTAVCERASAQETGLRFVLPRDQDGKGMIPYDIEAVALVEKPEIVPAAVTFVDWATSMDAMKVYSAGSTLTALRTDRDNLPGCFPDWETEKHWIGAETPDLLRSLANNRRALSTEWCLCYCGQQCDSTDTKSDCVPPHSYESEACPF